jgi:AraC family transcriptional regulator, positive regulator of tynA and feaB
LTLVETNAFEAAGVDAVFQVFPGLRMVLRGQLQSARLWRAGIGSGRAIRIGNLAQRVQRTANQRDETSGFLKLLLQIRGESLVVLDGKRARLSPGDLTLLDGARSFSLEFDNDYEQLLFQLPRDIVARRHEPLLGRVGQALRGDEPGNALVFEALSALVKHLDALSEGRRAQTLESIVALLGALEPASVESSASRRRLARAFVDLETHLANPELSAGMLASLQGISRRRLDAIFAEHGNSVERSIWERRLERIAADLSDPNKGTRRLVDIALSWGFNSEAHFSRAFRNKFGEPPSVYRRRHTPPSR